MFTKTVRNIKFIIVGQQICKLTSYLKSLILVVLKCSLIFMKLKKKKK